MTDSSTAAEPVEPPAATDRPAVGVEINGVTLTAGGRTLLDQATAHIAAGGITLIVGASGAGKTLLLRTLAGLPHDSDAIRVTGTISVDGQPVARAAAGRRIGIVFQQFALFDELSPLDNVRFALAHRAERRRPSFQDSDRAESRLEQLGVPTDVATSRLSGGQQQRLAIARTLAADPDLVLYDEPTSGLDSTTSAHVAELIDDVTALAGIADAVFLLDTTSRSLVELPREEWDKLAERLEPPVLEPQPVRGRQPRRSRLAACLRWTSRVVEETAALPWRLVPAWRSPAWGCRFTWHYAGLVAGPSAWLYMAVAGLITGFVTTYFTFHFLPYAQYTEPLLKENLLHAIGFALYRILVPVLVTILVAARCGAAVAADVGSKTYGRQLDALRSLRADPNRYLLTGTLYAFLVGTPLSVGLAFLVARWTSLVVFTAQFPDQGPDFWLLHFHQDLVDPATGWYHGTAWLLAKLLICAVGVAEIAYHLGVRPKGSSRDVSRSVTSTILWSTVFVLVVHFVFTFFEFEATR